MSVDVIRWDCPDCGELTKEQIAYDDCRMHDVYLSNGLMCQCGKPLAMRPFAIIAGGPEVRFDFLFQVWRGADSIAVEEQVEWSHVCPLCRGPADMVGLSMAGERHECLCCKHRFNVN